MSRLSSGALAVLSAIGCHEPNPAYKVGRDAAPPAPAPRAADAASPTPRITCPADRDLALCLRFERSIRDESPGALPFTVTGDAYGAGPDGLALDTNERTHIRTADHPSLQTTRVTIEAWVRARTVPGSGARASVVDYQRQYSLFVYADGAVRCSTSTLELIVPRLIRPGVWTSVACTADERLVAVWIDGVMRGSLPSDGFPPNPDAGDLGVAVNIPDALNPRADRLDGQLDNVRIWRRVRTRQEICAAALACAP